MIRLFFILIGFLLSVPTAEAIEAPEKSDGIISLWVEEVIDTAINSLESVDFNETCESTGVPDGVAQLFFALDSAVIQPQEDVARSMCHLNDIEKLEQFTAELITLSAVSCGRAAQRYENVIERVWQKLWELRRFGIDPDILKRASHRSLHDGPFHDLYPRAGIGSSGCRVPTSLVTNQNSDDVDLIDRFALFVRRLFPDAEEEVSEQNLPPVRTRELHKTILFVEKTVNPELLEYEESLRRSVGQNGAAGTSFIRDDLRKIALEHEHLEASIILSMRDPQLQMANIANRLHGRTTRLAEQVITAPSSTDDPPLRNFVRRYATFLSRMCPTRGCTQLLLDVIEKSQRDDCFSAIALHELADPASLEPCRAYYPQ